MISVGIIGCGKIADAHVAQIMRLPGCKIVGVCDQEDLMARQLYDRFPVQRYFDDVDRLLEVARPDVVHITTPPHSHYQLGKQCLEAGCHIYVEKPFALNTDETRRLLELAKVKGLKVTVGHDDQFSHAARRMRALIREGYVGGRILHMESYYCYDFGSEGYAKALLSDKEHWVRRLPGRLLHNIISHGVARISEFLQEERVNVVAHGFTSGFLKNISETDIIDEIRVIISQENATTAYFTFSSQMKPKLHQFRVYGDRNGLVLDEDQQTLIKLSGQRYKSYLEKFVPSYLFAKQYRQNIKYNAKAFLRNDFHMKSGMKFLIESFYKAIAGDASVPIPDHEILMTSTIMDEIFDRVYPKTPAAFS